MSGATITVDTNNFGVQCDRLIVRLDNAAQAIAGDGVTILHREVSGQLSLRSHPPGTPTNSPPGQPPALVTGNLRRSVNDRPAVRLALAVWQASLGVAAAYARIQDKGGRAGRDHAATLPARPYMRPAVAVARPLIARRAADRIRAALRRT